jgi:hypothetical protein
MEQFLGKSEIISKERQQEVNPIALRNKLQAVLIQRFLGFAPDNHASKVLEARWIEEEAQSFSDLFDNISRNRPDLIKRLHRLSFLNSSQLKAGDFTPEEEAAIAEFADILYQEHPLKV